MKSKDGRRKNFNTTLNIELYKKLKRLAFEKERHINDLLEEGIRHILEKYNNQKES